MKFSDDYFSTHKSKLDQKIDYQKMQDFDSLILSNFYDKIQKEVSDLKMTLRYSVRYKGDVWREIDVAFEESSKEIGFSMPICKREVDIFFISVCEHLPGIHGLDYYSINDLCSMFFPALAHAKDSEWKKTFAMYLGLLTTDFLPLFNKRIDVYIHSAHPKDYDCYVDFWNEKELSPEWLFFISGNKFFSSQLQKSVSRIDIGGPLHGINGMETADPKTSHLYLDYENKTSIRLTQEEKRNEIYLKCFYSDLFRDSYGDLQVKNSRELTSTRISAKTPLEAIAKRQVEFFNEVTHLTTSLPSNSLPD